MPSPIPLQDAQRALQALGVLDLDIVSIQRAPFPQAQTLLEELKLKAKRAYKRLALELHPDHTGGDQEKQAFFVLLGRVLAEFEKVTVHPPAPQQVFFVAHHAVPIQWIDIHWTNTSSSTTTSSSSGFTQTQVIRAVRMKPR
jgi:hypothetical protein